MFHEAIDSPSICQATSSQRTTGAMTTFGSSRSFTSTPEIDPAVQVANPSHQPRSTPV